MNSAEILKSTETDTFNINLISSDIDLLNKVKQIIELTGCSNDIAVTTLFDSNYNIEVAIDKIFDQTQRQLGSATIKTNNDWKEVAKNKKKQSATETSGIESNTESMIKELADFKISNDKLRSIHRGTGRGRARFTHNNGRNNYDKPPQINDKDNLVDTSGQTISLNKGGISRGRGRKSQYRVNSISHRGRSKHYGMNPDNNTNIFDGNIDGDTERFLHGESNKWNANYDVCNDWLSDNTAKSNEYFESDRHLFDNQHCDDNVLLPNPSNSALNTGTNGSNFVESCIESVEKSNDFQTLSTTKDIKSNQLNPLELVAKCSNKVDIFGGYSRTKPPALSSKVPSEPVKLLTSTGGVVRSNKTGFNFSFGLNFDEYSSNTIDGENTIGTSKSIVDSSESFISKIISNKQPPLSAVITTITNKSPNEYHQTSFSKSDPRLPSSGEKATGIMKSKQPLSASNEMFSSGPNNQRSSIDVTEKKILSSDTSTSGYKLSDDNHQPLNTTILSSSSQLCHPPGMSNAHMFQHFQNNQPYFSLLNISNTSSLFNSSCNMNSVTDFGDLAIGSSDDTAHQFMHPDKEYNHKPVLPNANSKHNIGVGVGGVQSLPTNSSSINQQIMLSKISDSDSNSHSSTILPAMPMSNICCFPPMYMNNFPNFMPAQVPPGHSNQPQPAPDATQSPVSNKPIYNLPNSHRSYQMPDEFDDMIQNQNKGKYQRTQNYPNFGVTGVSNKSSSQDVDSLDVEKTTKLASTNTAQINRQSNQPQNLGSANRTNQQQSMSNDPRFLTFHQHQSHPYQNNMFNCVTATGAHPAAPHPYAMAHQGGGLQQLHTQLHLMPQQMHSFPQSYQYQEHIMPSMVSNPSSRNNISQGSASSGNQSRNNRSGNQLWNPSN